MPIYAFFCGIVRDLIDLLLPERHALICERLQRDGRVFSGDLAVEFGVSEDTIRRDLKDLAAAGRCEKVYGGALPLQAHRRSLAERAQIAPDRKHALAKAAVSFIVPGSLVFFDAGSTNLAIADALPERLEITAVTNAPAIASVLIEKPAVQTILIGGLVDRAAGGAVGARAQRDLADIAPDLCILGACAIDADGGIRAFNYEDAAFKRHAATGSRATMVAVTAEKFDIVAPYAVLPADGYHRLVTEADVDRQRLEPLVARGCDIVLATD